MRKILAKCDRVKRLTHCTLVLHTCTQSLCIHGITVLQRHHMDMYSATSPEQAVTYIRTWSQLRKVRIPNLSKPYPQLQHRVLTNYSASMLCKLQTVQRMSACTCICRYVCMYVSPCMCVCVYTMYVHSCYSASRTE